MPSPLAISLTPGGHLLLRPAETGEASPEPRLAARIETAFERGQGAGLLRLGAAEAHTPLPVAFGFWRDLGRAFMAALCALPDLEEQRERADIHPGDADLKRLVLVAPPMRGAEYLSLEVLGGLWAAMLVAWRAEIAASGEPVKAWLTRQDPSWSLVGRVHLHLAENKRDEQRPFAFLATYTTGLAPNGKPQHRPLGDAVRAASSAADRKRLLALLAPVQRASERSALVRALGDSGRLFQPQAWTPDEALEFLRDVTPEATLSVADKEMPGFGEQMRRISLEFVPTAILSRQVAVIRGKTLIINLPGQPRAIAETLEGLKDADGKSKVPGIFAAVPYCVDLIGGPYIETEPGVCQAFRPKTAIKPSRPPAG